MGAGICSKYFESVVKDNLANRTLELKVKRM
jgi:hypothetical protein